MVRGGHLHIALQPERDEQVALQCDFRLHTARQLDGKLDAQCSRGGADGRLPRATQHTRQQSVSQSAGAPRQAQVVAASSHLAALEVNRAENIAEQPRVCAGAREARGVVAHPRRRSGHQREAGPTQQPTQTLLSTTFSNQCQGVRATRCCTPANSASDPHRWIRCSSSVCSLVLSCRGCRALAPRPAGCWRCAGGPRSKEGSC